MLADLIFKQKSQTKNTRKENLLNKNSLEFIVKYNFQEPVIYYLFWKKFKLPEFLSFFLNFLTENEILDFSLTRKSFHFPEFIFSDHGSPVHDQSYFEL